MQTDYNTYESLRAILEKETPILIAQIRALYRELDKKFHLQGAKVPITFGFDTDSLGSYNQKGHGQKEHFHFSLFFIGYAVNNPLSKEDRIALIKEKPEYGNIICRCEMITEGEIIDAIRRPLGAKSLDGVKRRTRAGMGRCQAGFCSPRTMEILARECHKSMFEITKSGGNSQIVKGINKDSL